MLVEIIADIMMSKRSNHLSENLFSQNIHHISTTAISRWHYALPIFKYGLIKSYRFVGEESYSKGSSKEYLIDDSPTWCKSRCGKHYAIY